MQEGAARAQAGRLAEAEANAAGLEFPGFGNDLVHVRLFDQREFRFRIPRRVLGQGGELAHQADEFFLDPIDEGHPLRIRAGGAGHAKGRVQFVHAAERLDPQRGFRDALAE